MLSLQKSNIISNHIPLTLLGITLTFSMQNAVADAQYSDWSTPENLGVNFNSSARDGCQYVSSDGLTMYVASDREGGIGGMDLYVSKRIDVDSPWQGLELITAEGINSEYWEICPALSQNGKVMYFTSERDGGCNDEDTGPNASRRDIYMTTREDVSDDNSWSAPVHLGCTDTGGFNTAATDQGPSFYEDKHGNTFIYFSSNRSGGKGGHDVYRVKLGDDNTPDMSTLENVEELNTDKNDHRPFVRKDGLEVYIDSNRDADPAGDHVYVATRKNANGKFSAPVLVDNIAEGGSNINRRPVLANDATELYYTANRAGGNGSVDVWVSTREKTE